MMALATAPAPAVNVIPWQAAEQARLERQRRYFYRTTLRICAYCGCRWYTFDWLACPKCHEYNRRWRAI